MMDVLHFRMDRALGTSFAAEAARDAKPLFDSNFHRLLKKAHLLRCDRPISRQRTRVRLRSSIITRLAPETFLTSLESGFLFMSLSNSF
jgi:hypothetical protein